MTGADIKRAAERELEKRRKLRQAEEGPTAFDASADCYASQAAFISSRSKRKVLRKTRRAGGTVALARSFLQEALREPYGNQLYVTTTLKNAKRLIWPTLKKLNIEKSLGGVANETEAFMRFPALPNEPVIYLGGAKDKEEIAKIRGYEGGLKRAAIDEAQSIRGSVFEELVDDVIEPSLLDYDGELDLVGTPGPVCAGYFHDTDVGDRSAGWDHFFLDLRDNPYLEKKSKRPVRDQLADLLKRRNWTEDNPTYRREYLGQWVTDSDALALHYDKDRNACAWQQEPLPGWRYIIAFDIGWSDADAIAVLGWAPSDSRLRLVREVITRKQGITELGNQIKLLEKLFRPQRIVGDMGALGKKIGEELRQRWGLPIVAAEKQRKAEHVGLLDDALLTGSFLAPPDSTFAEDCAIVTWDPDKKAKAVLEFSASYHSDIIDAVLYGYRLAFHWLEDAPRTAEEEARRLYLEGVERAVRNAERASPKDYDRREFESDLFDDM